MGQLAPRLWSRARHDTLSSHLSAKKQVKTFTVAHMGAYVCACARNGLALVLDQFTFLPTFFCFFASHLHCVRVTPEQSRRPCGRIRKWSIFFFFFSFFWEHSGIETEAAYVGIWMVNRWITQSGVFLRADWQALCCGISACMCVRERGKARDGGHGGVGIHPSPKYYAVVRNICNARRYFEKYLKKFNTALTFCWAFASRFTLHLIWRRVREDLCYCIMLSILNYVNKFSLAHILWYLHWNLSFSRCGVNRFYRKKGGILHVKKYNN